MQSELKITLEIENDALVDNFDEQARIIRSVADQIEIARLGGTLIDANGNTVGQWGYTDK